MATALFFTTSKKRSVDLLWLVVHRRRKKYVSGEGKFQVLLETSFACACLLVPRVLQGRKLPTLQEEKFFFLLSPLEDGIVRASPKWRVWIYFVLAMSR